MKYRKLSELTKLENNPRTITKEDFEILKKSISDNKDYFEARPLILSNRTGQLVIIGGNQRYEASKALGLDEVPTYLLENLTEEKEREIIIRDNVNNGEMDWDKLANEWEQEKLEEWGVKLPKDWGQEEAVEDEAPEVSTEPAISKLGEIYQLGRHRVMCGDSTKIEDVEKLMDGKKADMVFTDPPYGIEIVGGNGKVGAGNLAKNKVYSKVIGDDTTNTAKDCYNTCIALGMDKFIIWGGNYFTDFLPFSTSWIIWDKRGDMTSNNFADGEMAWTNIKSRVRIYKQIWNGMIREGEHENRVHPTQKPIKVLSEILKDFSNDNETIVDLFLGSGSTLIACEQTNRICYGCEIDNKYIDVIIKRWMKFTGQLAYKIIDADGKQCNEPVQFADESFMQLKK